MQNLQERKEKNPDASGVKTQNVNFGKGKLEMVWLEATISLFQSANDAD